MFDHRIKKGFTLAELLIVVAIIGVLVAVAIPIFSKSLDKAKEATCMANRRSLYAQIVSEHILSDRPCSELFNEFVSNAGKCPSGGTFSWEDSGNAGVVKCDYHDDNGDSSSGSSDTTPIHATPNLDSQDCLLVGNVIQDETGTCVILQGMNDTWLAYKNGTKVKDLVNNFKSDALPIDLSRIKDSSSTEISVGDIYYDSKENVYRYVTRVNQNEEIPLSGWVALLQ